MIERIRTELDELSRAGLYKAERVLASPQGCVVDLDRGGSRAQLVNFCSNNYLGLANDERVVRAASEALHRWGAGTASVRFICGTLAIHKELEQSIAAYLGMEDALLFAAAFDANGAVFEPLLGSDDAIISDLLNHASIIDGVRLSKASRYRYRNGDVGDLEQQLKQARADGCRDILIATDGVFSMDGSIAPLREIRELADRYEAVLMVDDCHATGILGPLGRGSFAHCGVKADIVTGTFGKALSGSMGGFVATTAEVVALLKQRGRPYLFSNALAPAICGAALKAIDIAKSAEGESRRARLFASARALRLRLEHGPFHLLPGDHPIIPVRFGDADKTSSVARQLLDRGFLVTPFSYPVVPHGAARIRIQVSSAHDDQQLEALATALESVQI